MFTVTQFWVGIVNNFDLHSKIQIITVKMSYIGCFNDMLVFLTTDSDDNLSLNLNTLQSESASTNDNKNEDPNGHVQGNFEDSDRDISSQPITSNGKIDGAELSGEFRKRITSLFTLSEDLILERGGSDALYYLRFQRHIIFFIFIVMLLSICVILPINLQGM